MSMFKPGLAVLLLLGGCVTQPTGPSVAVMPSPHKPFEVFREDQAICKEYASQQVAGQSQMGNNQQVLTGVAGTVLGAGLGAAIGGGRGAAIGAGAGALGGTAVGASQAERTTMSVQQRYNIAYEQCMYSRGNQVPGYVQPAPQGYAPPPPPPPPPGYPPPPPPPPR